MSMTKEEKKEYKKKLKQMNREEVEQKRKRTCSVSRPSCAAVFVS